MAPSDLDIIGAAALVIAWLAIGVPLGMMAWRWLRQWGEGHGG